MLPRLECNGAISAHRNLCGGTFFQPEELPLVFLVRWICWQQILSVFVCVEMNVFILPSSFKDVLSTKFLVSIFVSFSALNMSSKCLLAFVSDGKSAIHVFGVALYMRSYLSFFLLLLSRYFLLFGIFTLILLGVDCFAFIVLIVH